MAIKGGAPRAEPASETLVDPLTKGSERSFDPTLSQTRSSSGWKSERTEETSERPEVEPREEVLYRGMSKSETKSYKWRKEPSHPSSAHSSLAK